MAQSSMIEDGKVINTWNRGSKDTCGNNRVSHTISGHSMHFKTSKQDGSSITCGRTVGTTNVCDQGSVD